MKQVFRFDEHVKEYEQWFDEYPEVFSSEVEAIREMLPEGEGMNGIEVGVGTGRFARELGIKEGVDPSPKMRANAIRRGVEIVDASAEHLPYGDNRFDFVLMNFCISYFDNVHIAFREAGRVLKRTGSLIVGFIDKDSRIGRYYEKHKPESTFYRHANFYSVQRVSDELRKAGFTHLSYRQTLFHDLNEIVEFEPSVEGYGKGSFVVIRAMKRSSGVTW
jgi:ubiquinone/menaquinone biosynthesis C-methylase UbiE